MTAFGDALGAVKQVILLSERMEAMDKRISALASDVDGLATSTGNLRDRVSRLEGFLEGVGAGRSAAGPRLPPR